MEQKNFLLKKEFNLSSLTENEHYILNLVFYLQELNSDIKEFPEERKKNLVKMADCLTKFGDLTHNRNDAKYFDFRVILNKMRTDNFFGGLYLFMYSFYTCPPEKFDVNEVIDITKRAFKTEEK